MGADAGGWEGMVWCAPADNGTCHLYHIGGLKGSVVVRQLWFFAGCRLCVVVVVVVVLILVIAQSGGVFLSVWGCAQCRCERRFVIAT